MTEQPNQQDARRQALEDVVERVRSWQETATDDTVLEELDRGLREAGITLTDAQRYRVAHQISEGKDVDVAALSQDSEAGGPA